VPPESWPLLPMGTATTVFPLTSFPRKYSALPTGTEQGEPWARLERPSMPSASDIESIFLAVCGLRGVKVR
jgi:hypothetical protein